ncbi:unnamed protein product [Amoebophrya sp. A25]|nr:unnamed protein product [Amoebophrya sp. A25]|eukprot:GSA25T00003005001.1
MSGLPDDDPAETRTQEQIIEVASLLERSILTGDVASARTNAQRLCLSLEQANQMKGEKNGDNVASCRSRAPAVTTKTTVSFGLDSRTAQIRAEDEAAKYPPSR